MSLFVRLETGFWTHRKTMRLRAVVGDSAFWIPPRLWCYAAEHQPDGDFSDYTAEELALLIGYSGDACSMLEALQRVSFFDGMRLHGWEERNSYHKTFSDRAKKAAKARWSGKEKIVKREEKRREEGSIASSMLEAFGEFWNAYPRRVGKANAEKAWAKLGCSKLLPQILVAVRACKISADWTKDAGQFIPHPATWLNRRGWEDELGPQKNGKALEWIPSAPTGTRPSPEQEAKIRADAVTLAREFKSRQTIV